MIGWAIILTLPYAFILLVGWIILRMIFPHNKPLLKSFAAAGLASWLGPCLFFYVPIREIVYRSQHTNRALYHFLKALGFSGDLSYDIMAMWNLLVLGFWLALLIGTATYLYTRKHLRQEKASRASNLLP